MLKKIKSNVILISILFLVFSCSFHAKYIKDEKIGFYDDPAKALLVIDIQEDFTGENAKMPVDTVQAGKMLENVNKLVLNAQQKGMIIIYIKNVFPENAYIANFFRNNAAIQGTPGTDFDNRLVINSNYIFSKSRPDAFSNKEFERFLIDNKVTELYLTGVFADQCVYRTAKGALNRGYKIIYVKDAVASGSLKNVENAVKSIEKSGGIITESAFVF